MIIKVKVLLSVLDSFPSFLKSLRETIDPPVSF